MNAIGTKIATSYHLASTPIDFKKSAEQEFSLHQEVCEEDVETIRVLI